MIAGWMMVKYNGDDDDDDDDVSTCWCDDDWVGCWLADVTMFPSC